MSSAAVVIFALFAFLTAPAAFVLIWILYRQTGRVAMRYLALAVLANSFVLLGNLLTALSEGAANTPYGVYVLLLDEVTIFTIIGCAYVCRLAHDATRTRLPGWLVVVFWAWAFLLHAVVLASAILPAPAGRSVTTGFATMTLAALLMMGYATVVVIAGRRRIPADFVIPHPVGSFLAVFVLGVLAAANDVFQFGSRIGGVAIPFSPFFAILADCGIIVLVGRRLIEEVRAGETATKTDSGAWGDTFGLTLRESEILPLLLEGATNEEIGARLNISPHTVKNHISVIFRKTGARNRFDLLKTVKRATIG